jgi:flagellar biosynthesis/type III secretory pathway protein FliH
VETYLELQGRDAKEFEVLWSREPNREARTMFMTWSERLETKGWERGIEQGLERGIEQGREQGLREILLRQLSLRFGPLPASVHQRVDTIRSVDRLTRIAEQVLVARSLDEIDFR